MDTLSRVLKQLPGLKTSEDFAAAIAELEREHASAASSVEQLEAGREARIFDGGDILALEGDIETAQRAGRKLSPSHWGALARAGNKQPRPNAKRKPRRSAWP